ncbi:MAG TPA: VOC family protein, partial [Planctomycetota bacterium]|nr:VOC family protein [Planctomycetota bacterium]
RAFYEKLGFSKAGGVQEQNWLILRNGTTTIGLFQGMFEKNCLTFNPGWGAGAQPLERFTDVREIQARVEEAGLELVLRADPESTGVAHFTLLDPDGNPVLVDQHVPRPKER